MVGIDFGVTLEFQAGHNPVHGYWIIINPVCDAFAPLWILNEYKDKKVNAQYLSNKDLNPCWV